jgi:hypothetical protein
LDGKLTIGCVTSNYDALVSINVPDEKAKAVIDAMEREMMGKLATKADLAHVQELLSRDMLLLKSEMERRIDRLGSQLTTKLGSLAVVLTGILFGLLKLTS